MMTVNVTNSEPRKNEKLWLWW